MRLVLQALAVLVVSVSLVSPALARDIFVNNVAGDDRATGHNPQAPDESGPVRTITKALRLARQGDHIFLANTGQPYRESISLVGSQHSGFLSNRFCIFGNGAILDGSNPVPPIAWESFRGPMFRFQPPRMAHQQLFLSDRPVRRVIANPLADAPPKLEPLTWCLHRGYLYFCVEPLKLPEDYPLSFACQRVGITLFHVDRVCISDLVIQGFQLDGVNAYNSVRDVMLERVTCRGNGRSGLAVGAASLVHLGASLVGNNGEAQVLALPLSELHVRDTQLLSNTAPGLVNQDARVYLDGKAIPGGIDAWPAKE
jgi:hypothetical protein